MLKRNGPIFLCLVVAGVFVFKAITVFWADSEMWAVTLSKQKFFALTGDSIIPPDSMGMYFKPLHHLLIKFTYYLTPESWDLLVVNRSIGAVIGLTVAAVYAQLYSKTIGKKQDWPIAFVAILTTTLFFERGFRIRADLLASLFHGLVLLEFFRLQTRKTMAELRSSIALLSLYELALIATAVKYLPVVLALQFLYLVTLYLAPNREKWVQAYGTKFLTMFFIGVGGFFAIQFFKPEFVNSFSQSLMKYAFDADKETKYEVITKFVHIFRIVRTNPVVFGCYFSLVLFSLIRLIALRKKAFEQDRNINYLTFYSVIFGGMILLSPEKYAYFIASTSPLFVILGLRYFKTLSEKLGFNANTRTIVIGLLAIKFIAVTFTYRGQFTNVEQKKYRQYLEKYITENNIKTYYDPVGILPRKMNLIAFLGPNQKAQNIVSFDKVIKHQPQLIICIDKCKLFPKNWQIELKKHYTPIDTYAFALKGLPLSPYNPPTKTPLFDLFRYDI